MSDGAAVHSGGGAPRRFRQRGGAKKKKKPRPDESAHTVSGEHHSHSRDHNPRERPAAPAQSHAAFHGYESQLDPELARYLYQLRDDLERIESDPTAHDPAEDGVHSPVVLLSRNGLHSLLANLHEVALEPMGSRILESLIKGAGDDPDTLGETLSALLALGARRVAVMAQHRCGSHVLQAIVAAVAGAAGAGAGSGTVMAAMEALAAVLGQWSLEEVASVMSSSCGSHVFRVIVASLAGIPAEEPKEQKLDDSGGSARLKTYIERGQMQVPREWMEAVSALGQRLYDGDDHGGLQDFLWAPSSSAAFQGLLAAVSCADREVAKLLVKGALKDSSYLDVSFDACGARFMERVVVCLGTGFVLPNLKGSLAQMADDGKANFVLQRVLLGLKGRGAVMSAWDELEPSLPRMTGIGSVRDGVVLAMIRAAECEGDEQTRRRAARSIAKTVGATGASAKHLAGILITGSLERWERWRANVKEWGDSGMGVPPAKISEQDEVSVLHYGGAPGLSLLGILMARSLMRFPGGPGQGCRDSMANLSSSELLALCAHPSGSRLIEQWTDSDQEFVNGKSLSSIMNAVLDTGTMGALSRSPYGAQVLARVIPRAPGALRKRGMEALAARAEHLRDHPNGRQVVRKCRVDDYIRRGDEWEQAETARDTRERLFEDILAPQPEREGKCEEDVKPILRKPKREKKERKKQKETTKGTGDPENVDDGRPEESGEALVMNESTHEQEETPKKAKRGKRKRAEDELIESQQDDPASGLDGVLSAISNAAQKSKKKRKSKSKA